MRGFLLTQVKAALKHGDFTPWVEKELGCGVRHAQQLLAVAALPNPAETKGAVHPAFDIQLNVDELAAAKLLAVANLPSPDEIKSGTLATFENPVRTGL